MRRICVRPRGRWAATNPLSAYRSYAEYTTTHRRNAYWKQFVQMTGTGARTSVRSWTIRMSSYSALCVKMQEAGRRVQIAEVNRVLTKADLYDGVHPSADGYAKMGQFWYQKLSAYLRGETELPDVTVTTTVPVTETTAAVTTTTAAAALTAGDTDGNGVTEAIDAVMLAKHLSTERLLDDAQAERADMDGDRDISAVDLTLLKRVVPY